MASNERIRKYLDAGSVLGQVTRGRAEEIVRELVNAGEIPRSQAQEWVDTMVEQSKKMSENLLELVRREVHTQLSKIDSASIEEIATQVAVVLKKSAEAGRNATAGATQAAKTATAGATQAAKTATDEATKAAKSATAGATKAAKGAKEQAEKTAGRARDAAEAAVPKRNKSKKAKNEDKGHKKDKKKKKDKVDKGDKGESTVEKVVGRDAPLTSEPDSTGSAETTAPQKAS
jgi:polyhydroxyalkanoate synthesis regulator phasin